MERHFIVAGKAERRLSFPSDYESHISGTVTHASGIVTLLCVVETKRYYLVAPESEFAVSLRALTPPSVTIDVSGILNCANELEKNFSDFQIRQTYFVKLKAELVRVRNQLDTRNEPLLLLVGMIADAIENIRSERLTLEQVQEIKAALSFVNQIRTRDEAFKIQKKLISIGLRPVPSLGGVAELYDL